MAVTTSNGQDPDQAPTVTPTAVRNLELVLLGFVAVLVTGALVLVEANQKQQLTQQLLLLGLAFLGVTVIGHLAVRKFAPYADPLMLPCAVLLNGLGLVMIYRLDLAKVAKAAELGREAPVELVGRQVLWSAVAILLFVAVIWLVRDHRRLEDFAFTAGLAALVLLVLPVIPGISQEINGARIWLRLGPFSIQPGEFAKILLIIFVSAFLVRNRELFTVAGRRFLGIDFPQARHLAPLLVAWGLSIGVLVVEKDLGSSLLTFGIVLVLLYVGTERVSWLVVGLSIFAAGATVAYQLFDHVQLRVKTWIDPFSTCVEGGSTACFDKGGFQIAQSLFGLGTGGVGGTGLGAGRPDLVPFSESDFIFSSLGEELGLIGLAAILVIYLVLITRGLRAALAISETSIKPDTFGKLLATGLAFTLALQVFVVAGGASKLIPLTGLTLPFLSYGGSSLWANYILVALLLRVSNASRAPAPTRPAAPLPPIGEAGTELVVIPPR